MPAPRKQLVSLADTPWYHIVSRCVRRSWLCGVDPYNGIDYSHRREWVVSRLKQLVDTYAIEISAYSVMSNHTHLVVCVDQARSKTWTDQEVVERWHKLYHGNLLSQRFAKKEALPEAERIILQDYIDEWRERLSSISWFMAATWPAAYENIARKANIEDEVTGKYWEARFKSQALLDDQAVLACMVYVDLNPVRALMAQTPEESDYTSIQERIEATKKGEGDIPKKLMRFQGAAKRGQVDGIPCALKDYIELVDATGRAVREGKRGAIAASQSPILQRLKIDPDTWLHIATTFEASCGPWTGDSNRLEQVCSNIKKKHWICATEGNQRLYPP